MRVWWMLCLFLSTIWLCKTAAELLSSKVGIFITQMLLLAVVVGPGRKEIFDSFSPFLVWFIRRDLMAPGPIKNVFATFYIIRYHFA